MRVLVVEDNFVNLSLVVNLLEKEGFVARTANSGVEALAMLAKESFDLVLMDVQMPIMDGLEATKAIRKKEIGGDKRIPIVAVTAYAMTGDREACLQAGMDGYLSKPIRKLDLMEAINALMPPPRAYVERPVREGVSN